MSDMIERVAMALHGQHAKRCAEHGSTCAPFYGPDADPRYRANLLEDARAVLTAMREPTEWMLKESGEVTWWEGHPISEQYEVRLDPYRAEQAWQAMIDAALSD